MQKHVSKCPVFRGENVYLCKAYRIWVGQISRVGQPTAYNYISS